MENHQLMNGPARTTTSNSSHRGFLHAALVAICAISMNASSAAEYPEKPVRIIVPNSPGSSVDSVARAIGKRLTEIWDKQVVIDNRSGAGGIIAHEMMADALPDGYTLLYTTSAGLIINPIMNKVKYDSMRDFTPISLAVINTQMLVTTPSLGAANVSQLVALARSRPGKLNCASPGAGTSNHLSCELLKTMTGTNFVHVPYKGTSAAITDLVGGQVEFMFNSMGSVYPLAKAGKLRALGVGSKKRSVAAPEVPTIAETIPGFESGNWNALLGPRGLPPAITAKLNAVMVKIFSEQAFAQRLIEQGNEPQTGTPAALTAFMREETVRWTRVIQQAGLPKAQ